MKKRSDPASKVTVGKSKKTPVRSHRRRSAGVAVSQASSGPIGQENSAARSDSDETAILARARTSWYCGDWNALVAVDPAVLTRHPDRGTLALLVASAQQQLGEHDAARRGIRLAMHWGCSSRLIAQVLIAGLHNTLGRAAALSGNNRQAVAHFAAAVAPGGKSTDGALLSHVRSVRELAHLGLLPDAAALLDQEIEKARNGGVRPAETQARIEILQTEVELLRHELSLAQQRQQLSVEGGSAIPILPARPEDPEWLSALKRKSSSQLGQDLWVLEQCGYKRDGFFVEFGATDGVLLSNTFLLEKEFHWRGICAEPNPKLFEELKKNRRCIVSRACIAGLTGDEVDFIFADAYGGFAKYAMDDMHAGKRAAYAAAGETARLKCISLDDFLNENNAPRDIDYLSVDTEGSEFEILSSFRIRDWNIRLITVEHNYSPQRERIRALLCGAGYRFHEHEWDDWYVSEAFLGEKGQQY